MMYCVAEQVELYRTVLVDTPVASYYERYFNSELKTDEPGKQIGRVYSEVEVDIITNMLQKLWLEDFYVYTQSLGVSHRAACVYSSHRCFQLTNHLVICQ
jgi:hypothetical protein